MGRLFGKILIVAATSATLAGCMSGYSDTSRGTAVTATVSGFTVGVYR